MATWTAWWEGLAHARLDSRRRSAQARAEHHFHPSAGLDLLQVMVTLNLCVGISMATIKIIETESVAPKLVGG